MGGALELWGGIECTVARVGDRYVDQIQQSGHADRDDDLELMAETGIRTWRYPFLWERVAPDGLDQADWGWVSRRLDRMQALGLDPIAGLLHHGSGPRTTDLLDERFPEKLAEYADAVASRHPWVRKWTPVNEPLSTARFSALDGHWYPHTRTEPDFARAIVNECTAIALCMRAIRRHVPEAELVFTEDFCRQSSTPGMRRECQFRSDRRWLALDLVLGRVDGEHPFHRWLLERGVDRRRLDALVAEPTPIAVVGGNYYVTSDRFLDDHPERHPRWRRFMGSDGLYGETESVRCTAEGIVGHRSLLVEAWQRYHLPVAIAEVHLGCTREEQVRWLLEAWDAANLARQDGADVRAVTIWGAFGLIGWDKLAVQPGGTYEPGMFDIRSPKPRKTALCRVASALARGEDAEAAAPYGGAGWWRKPSRLLGHPPLPSIEPAGPRLPLPAARPARPLLVIGGGAVAREVVRAAELRGLMVSMPGRALDPTDPDAVAAELDKQPRPWAIFYAAGVRDRAAAEHDPFTTARLHAEVPGVLAEMAQARGIRLLTLSSALVVAGGPVGLEIERTESSPVRPIGVLGQAQAEGERRVGPLSLTLRCGLILGTDRQDDPLARGLEQLANGGRWVVPAHAPVALAHPLVHTALDLLIDGESGLWHLSHRKDYLALAQEAAKLAGFDTERVRAVPNDVPLLASERGPVLPAPGRALQAWLGDFPVGAPSATEMEVVS